MMKKNAILLTGVAVLALGMTGCIDNDEPASVENLRNAKANELNANAELTKAQAALVNAQVAIETAKAAQEELNTKMKELDYELAKADNEVAIEQAKADLAMAQANAEAAAIAAQAAITEAQTELNNAKVAAIKAKNTQLSNAISALSNAQYNMANEAKYLQQAQQSLAVAVASAERDSITVRMTYEQQVLDYKNSVASAEYSVLKAEQTLAELKESIESGDLLEQGKWLAIYNEKQAEIEKINVQINEKEYSLKVAKNATDAAEQALNDAADAIFNPLEDYNDIVKIYSFNVSDKLVEAIGYLSVNNFSLNANAIQSNYLISNDEFASEVGASSSSTSYLLPYIDAMIASDSDNEKEWKALKAEVEAIVDEIETEQQNLVKAQAEAYPGLQTYVDAVLAAEQAEDDIETEISNLEDDKNAAQSIANFAYNLVNWPYQYMTDDEFADQMAYEIAQQEQSVESEKLNLAKAQADLEKAQATLDAYNNGTLRVETAIANAKADLEAAQIDYDGAKAIYDLKKAEYDAIVATLG